MGWNIWRRSRAELGLGRASGAGSGFVASISAGGPDHCSNLHFTVASLKSAAWRVRRERPGSVTVLRWHRARSLEPPRVASGTPTQTNEKQMCVCVFMYVCVCVLYAVG